MKRATGNIWDLADSHWIVISTNCGWDKNGCNVMGKGIAAQAALKFPQLPKIYGTACRDSGLASYMETFMAWGDGGLILFPVKPLLPEAPQYSWRQPASLKCIESSCKALLDWMTHPAQLFNTFIHTGPPLIALPMVGCGAGGLKPTEVIPILERFFGPHDNVVLVGQAKDVL